MVNNNLHIFLDDVKMKITYKNKKEEIFYSDFRSLNQKHGKQVAERIIQRINELDAAECILDLPPIARTHPYEPKNEGIFSIDLLKHKHSVRLFIQVDCDFDINNYKTIKQVKILKIKKIHS